VFLVGLAGATLVAAQANLPGTAPVIELTQAELQAQGEPPQAVLLPYRIYRDKTDFTSYRVVLRFDAPAALVQARATLALESWPDGGHIKLNEVEVADIATSTETSVARYLRPFAFNLPPGALREQGNVLLVEWGSRGTLVMMPRPSIGPRELLEPLIERKVFWEHSVVQASTVFALVIGGVMGLVGWQQRRRHSAHRSDAAGNAEREYLLIGATAFGWIVYNLMFMWSPLPAEMFVWRRTIGFAGIGVFAMGMWVSLTRLAAWRSARFEALCWAWAVLAPLQSAAGYWLTGDTHMPRSEGLWALGGALLGGVPMAVVLRAAWRQLDLRLALLVAFVLIAVVLAVREALIHAFTGPVGTLQLGLQLLAPLWLATASAILVQDFVQALRAAERERSEVDRRLAAREAELARLHAREREHATLEERQRIMQDMHDGLGSQLISSLSMAERGLLNPAQTAELLRGCIDDLRLAIDTLTDANVDVALTVGNLRFRMEPRLRAAGLRVRWDTQALPEAMSLPGTTALPLLRVLQEALANAVKHAGAHTISVALALDGQDLVLAVNDDGHGFDLQHHTPGKGLAGMHKRARGLGAQLRVDSTAQGTRVHLRLRLPLSLP
jgi:signal transduction histidine kinase